MPLSSGAAGSSTSSLMGAASVNIPSIATMLPKHLLVGRDEELAILTKLYDKSCDCLQSELDELQHELLQHSHRNNDVNSHHRQHHSRQQHDRDRLVQKTNSGDTLVTSHATSSSPAKKKKRLSRGSASSLSSGGSVLIHLQGKPGVGKTSLVNQFVREIKNRQTLLASSSPRTTGSATNIPTTSRTTPGSTHPSRSAATSKKLFVSR